MLKRINFMMGFFLVMSALLLSKLFYYQIVKGEELTAQVVNMRSQSVPMREFARGDILDRNQQPLTQYTGSYSLYCRLQAIPAPNGSRIAGCRELAAWLAPRLDRGDEQEIAGALIKASGQGKQLLQVKPDLSDAEVIRLQQVSHPALEMVPQLKRYRQDGFLAHVIGYVESGGTEGQAGIEKSYNSLLQHSESGQRIRLMQDGRGQAIPGLGLKINSTGNGKDAVVLTIDARVQQLAESNMNKSIARGAVVVMDVHSKEILAMASRPTYNQYRVDEYLTDLQSPLMNRALSSYYPGSLFKILVSTALVENNMVKPGEKFNCSGKYVFNDQLSISCWKEEGHGEVSFEQALAQSCNPTFITLGSRLGKDRLLEYVDRLHLLDPEIIGMTDQQTDSYVRIDAGNAALANACLGQEGVMLTPVQIVSLLATVADDGYWAPPRMVKYTLDEKGSRKEFASAPGEQVISANAASKVQSMLELVVAAGTGQSARLPGIGVAGKTATSQTGRIKTDGEEVLNTWFAGYLPADQPRWAIVILAEEGKSGAENCAPVFKAIAQGLLDINP
ncbi:MAG TPA: penicillin-binding protein 2 [Syntrophomonas sp.]|nr:penicillin-binding protein 2 [Syntrophomonas sp.]